MLRTAGFLLVGMAPVGGRTSGALQLGFLHFGSTKLLY